MAKTKYLTKALRCPDGTRKYIRGKTQKELDEKVRQAQMELGMGINIADSTTFSELAQTWLDLCKRPKVKDRTAQLIVSIMNIHVIPYIGHLRVRDIRPAHIAGIMSHINGFAKATQSNILSRIKEVFQFAIDNRIIAVSPVTSQIKPGGYTPAERSSLTDDQILELLDAAKYTSDDLYTFVLLGLFAGLRRGEALGLCWDCVDLTGNTITVRRQMVSSGKQFVLTDSLKTGSSNRVIPIPAFLSAYLQARKRTSEAVTVVGAMKSDEVYRITGGLSRLSSVDRKGSLKAYGRGPLNFYVHPHLLRHTYASKLMENGADLREAQYLLGHATPAMTLRVYTHYHQKSRQQNTAQKVEGAFRFVSMAETAQG